MTTMDRGKDPVEMAEASQIQARFQSKPEEIAADAVPIPAISGETKPVRNYRLHTKRLVSRKFDKVIEKMAEESLAGSLPHTKYLFEIGGVKEDIEQKALAKREPSLAKLLLAEVRKRRKAELAEAAKAEANKVPGEEAGPDQKDMDCGARRG